MHRRLEGSRRPFSSQKEAMKLQPQVQPRFQASQIGDLKWIQHLEVAILAKGEHNKEGY